MQYRYIFFDVANTLIYKPHLFEVITKTLKDFGVEAEEEIILKNHKILSEIILSPQKTSHDFYQRFNSQLLYILGIIPTPKILDAIYQNCVNLAWEKFEDTEALKELGVDLGVISNWDESLPEKLEKIFDFKFKNIIYSSAIGVEKPNLEIFTKACLESKIPANEILYIGDSIKLDMEPASKVGFKNVLIDRNGIYPYFKGIKISSLNQLKAILND